MPAVELLPAGIASTDLRAARCRHRPGFHNPDRPTGKPTGTWLELPAPPTGRTLFVNHLWLMHGVWCYTADRRSYTILEVMHEVAHGTAPVHLTDKLMTEYFYHHTHAAPSGDDEWEWDAPQQTEWTW